MLLLLDMSNDKLKYYTIVIYILIDKVLAMGVTDNIKIDILNRIQKTSNLLEKIK